MMTRLSPTLRYTLIVSLGGFIFGFDASVISGAISAIAIDFSLSPWQQGLVVSSPTLGALIAMFFAGPLSDRLGRRTTLIIIAFMYLISALCSAFAASYSVLLAARFIGGMAFCSLLIAPVYIAEISTAAHRGKMVSVNQLNIVLGFALSYFSNYYFLQLSQHQAPWVSEWGLDSKSWRYMLGMEAIPALAWFVLLFFIPRSPRWLLLRNKPAEAEQVAERLFDAEQAKFQLDQIRSSFEQKVTCWRQKLKYVFGRPMRFALMIGLLLAIAQQVTGINVVFFYAPTIFEQSGVGTDAAFMQAVWIGVVNVVFTLVAMATIDKWGRRPLLLVGLTGVVVSMAICAYGFSQASYRLDAQQYQQLVKTEPKVVALAPLVDKRFDSDVAFKSVLKSSLGDDAYAQLESRLLKVAIEMNAPLVLIGITGFVAAFAMSLGPVMWVIFSEIFPNQVRGIAISVVGVVNSSTSFLVQLIFPWELNYLGAAVTFAIYGVLALLSGLLIWRYLPETRACTLEQVSQKYQN